jgi:hypothetical protein
MLSQVFEKVLDMQTKQMEVMNKVLDVVATSALQQSHTTNHNTVNTINSHNKTFNLHFFLNEQCKDAMNITEFVDSIPLQAADLENVGRLGYVEGVAKLISSQLSTMDVHKRPIHCSDAKRQVLHIKHEDKWQREQDGFPILRGAIKTVGHGLLQSMSKWTSSHPSATDSHSPTNDLYLKILKQITGGFGDYEDNNTKIMKKIAKLVVILKSKDN